MTTFFVGQKVRIVDSGDVCAEFVGVEAVVVDTRLPEHHVSTPRGVYSVRPDSLRPIQPSGHQPAEYIFQDLMDECRQGETA